MCGICGFTGRENNSILKGMTDSIIHRGPDEDGFYSNDKVNLGVRRLSIIDVKTGQQPVFNEDRSICVVFNGEVYNFQELRKDLEGKGHKFYTDHSDSEVIVHLYEEHGIDFTHKINGMFAIALWDKKNEKLFLIRDRMGVKPLFYAFIGSILIFGSEIKAILKHPMYCRKVNYESVYHYFTFKNIPAPFTAFDGIFSLLPGERLIYSKSNIFKEKWWKISFNEDQKYDEGFVKNKIFQILEDATRLRMISDVPFGAYLSGGVDSSAVVALMTRYSNKPIKTFSLGYEDELKNKEADLYYARKVSQTYKTEHYEYIMSYKELVNEIKNVILSFDQPFSGTISTFFLSKLIRKHVKLALSGDGADELFGSYLSHRTARPIHYFSALNKNDALLNFSEDEKRLFSPCDHNFLKDLYNKSNGDEARWRYCLYLFNDEEKNNLLSDVFKSKVHGVTSLGLIKENFSNLTANDPLNRILEMEWNTQFPDQVLAFVDSLSMAHSVEIRSPFLDYRLAEFVATIPGSMKIKNGNVKDILKKAVEPILPEEIVNRPKEGFVLPIYDWMAEELKSYCVDTLSTSRLKKHGFLQVESVNQIVQSYYSGDKSKVGRVWNLIMFQVWWEEYFC